MYFMSSFFSKYFIRVQEVQPYINTARQYFESL